MVEKCSKILKIGAVSLRASRLVLTIRHRSKEWKNAWPQMAIKLKHRAILWTRCTVKGSMHMSAKRLRELKSLMNLKNGFYSRATIALL